ncbi:MAG: hypothetical protein ABSD97_03550 [Acidimicrobiales bacterium]|jgi:hypothetical protein
MIPSHMIHQAERPINRAEQREADRRTSELAATFAQLCNSLLGPARAMRLLNSRPAALVTKKTAQPGVQRAWLGLASSVEDVSIYASSTARNTPLSGTCPD